MEIFIKFENLGKLKSKLLYITTKKKFKFYKIKLNNNNNYHYDIYIANSYSKYFATDFWIFLVKIISAYNILLKHYFKVNILIELLKAIETDNEEKYYNFYKYHFEQQII